MNRVRRISGGTVLSSLALVTGLALVMFSQGQEEHRPGSESPKGVSKPFVPSDSPTDTLSAPQKSPDAPGRMARDAAALGKPVMLAAADGRGAAKPATGPVETFLQAEARSEDQDFRYLAVTGQSSSPRPPDSTAVKAVKGVKGVKAAGGTSNSPTGSGDPKLTPLPLHSVGVDLPAIPRRTKEELVQKIDELRTSFYEEAPVPQEVAERTMVSPGNSTSGIEEIDSETDRNQPFASVQPAKARATIGKQVSERTTATETASPSGSHSSEVSVYEGPVAVPTAPFAEIASAAPAPSSPERKGLLGRIFSKKPTREERAAELAAAANSSSLEQFPHPDAPRTKASKEEDEAQESIDRIYEEYVQRVSRITAEDLVSGVAKSSVPSDITTVWLDKVKGNYWKGEEPLAVRLEEVYARALMNSNQIKVFGYDPLIRESGIQEAEGAFDVELFSSGTYGHSDEPTSSLLDTGETGRFLEDRGEGEAGLRRRFSTGGQISLSNRFLSLDNNSQFLEPNPQTTSSVVLSVVQPLLKGGGYHYNKARLKVAKIDSGMAASEYISRLEKHLLEVNQAYWGVYFARAAFVLRQSLVGQTDDIVNTLEARSDEATASELLRARSELFRRRTGLNRSEMAIRNAEEKLRSLVNDPEFPIGGPGEFVPVTAPVLSPPKETVHAAAMEAADNRPEIALSFGQLRIAAIRHQAGKHEKMPQLDLMAESRVAGLDANRRFAGAYDNMMSQDASWLVGFQFTKPWDNNSATARQERLQYEMFQKEDEVRSTMDTILLESVVTYREMMTVYRDLEGNYQQVISTREELRGLRERLDFDAENDQTVAYRLQNMMDALERSQIAEEQFLVSVVTYNIAFAALERAKGTFLKIQDVAIERSPLVGSKRLETLRAVPMSPSVGDSGPMGGAPK